MRCLVFMWASTLVTCNSLLDNATAMIKRDHFQYGTKLQWGKDLGFIRNLLYFL
jgi:hypothetical protein